MIPDRPWLPNSWAHIGAMKFKLGYLPSSLFLEMGVLNSLHGRNVLSDGIKNGSVEFVDFDAFQPSNIRG